MCVDDYWGVNGFTICISNEGDVYSFGKHAKGAHGHEELSVFPERKISSLKNIKSISCGENHTICLDNHGNVFSFGSNHYGQLGVEKEKVTLGYTHYIQTISLPLIKQVSCGRYFSICLSEDGNLYSFGYNNYGQLGHGNHQSIVLPKKIEVLENVLFVRCGSYNVFCKLFNDHIYGWGLNNYGQLGIGNTENKNIPFNIICWPKNIVDIKCGEYHTLVLTLKRNVFSCGYNVKYQLGREIHGNYSKTLVKITSLSEIIRIECGNFNSMCIDKFNNVYVFGDNRYAQLGLGDTKENRKIPIQHPALSNIIDISCGGNHIFVKNSLNEIYAFGNNRCLQLGIKTKKDLQRIVLQVLKENENIWSYSNKIMQQKSARFISERPNEQESPPKKKRKQVIIIID